MAKWDIRTVYDGRFNAMAIQVEHEGEMSPVHSYSLANILKMVPEHELKAAMLDEYQDTEEGQGIDQARRRMLGETDWKDKVVLDVGGFDGFAAEIAHKGGAKKAICLDSEQWRHYGWTREDKEGVEYVKGDYMHISKINDILFGMNTTPATPIPDTIIYFNILYHVWNPIAALKHLRSLIKPGGEMLLCTLFRYHPGSWAYFYEAKECNETDESVFWAPSLECLERWLRNTGWEAEKYAVAYDRVLYRCKATLEPQYRQSEY